MKPQLKILERDTLRACLDYLEIKRVFYYRNNSGATIIPKADGGTRFFKFGVTGSPDIICVIKGQYVGLECKAPKGKQSESQIDFQQRLEKAGGKYLLVYS